MATSISKRRSFPQILNKGQKHNPPPKKKTTKNDLPAASPPLPPRVNAGPRADNRPPPPEGEHRLRFPLPRPGEIPEALVIQATPGGLPGAWAKAENTPRPSLREADLPGLRKTQATLTGLRFTREKGHRYRRAKALAPKSHKPLSSSPVASPWA